MELNGWDGWAFGQPNHPYPAATWGASHYRKASDRFIGTQVHTYLLPNHSYQVLHTRKARRGKGGQALQPPLNAHAGQSGLQETFWYHQVVSDEETPTLDQIPGVERQLRRNGTLSTSALGTDAWTVHCRDTSTSPGRVAAVRCPTKYTTMDNTTTREYGVEWYGKTIPILNEVSFFPLPPAPT